ncbi:hypothetical protein Tco_0738887 [Tanacetum coccineum]
MLWIAILALTLCGCGVRDGDGFWMVVNSAQGVESDRVEVVEEGGQGSRGNSGGLVHWAGKFVITYIVLSGVEVLEVTCLAPQL